MPGPHVSRRTLLAASGALLCARPFAIARAALPFADPFTLGVASGCPRPDTVVLWTRLAPDPLTGGGMPDDPVEVDWEIAEDDRFVRVVARGTATARPELGHSVHVEPGGLRPGWWYWYRFRAGSAISPVGRTRTAPAEGSSPGRLRFAMASCQQYEQGYFSAYRHMAGQDLDLVVHLGDYIYEESWGRTGHVRKHLTGNPTSLWEFRNRHALYKSDPDLQATHAAFPWLVTWDDHEVDDDYANDGSRRMRDPEFFMKVRAAAYQAYYEHMPLPPSAAPRGPAMTLYGGYRFGDLLEMLILDDRQYRSHQSCMDTADPRLQEDCPDSVRADRTMLGSEQEAWLDARLQSSRGRWTALAQQTLMAEIDRKAGEGRGFWMDGWDGYAAGRDRLLRTLGNASNPIVIGGDVHAFWATDLKTDFRDPASPAIATEFVTSSITSDGPGVESVANILAENPHVRYGRGDKRGYATVELRPDRCTIGFEGVDNVKAADSGVARIATFAVENGRPGAQRA